MRFTIFTPTALSLYISEPDASTFNVPVAMQHPPSSYRFNFIYGSAHEQGFVLKDKTSLQMDDSWDFMDESCSLHLENLGSNIQAEAGGLLFEKETTGEKLAVLIGIDRGQLWSNIETTLGVDETLSEVLGSSYPFNGGWEGVDDEVFDRISKVLPRGNFVNLAAKKFSFLVGNGFVPRSPLNKI
jgi:hypothetical protein